MKARARTQHCFMRRSGDAESKVNSRKRNDNPWAPFRPISPPLRGDVDLLDATPPPLLESTR